MSLQVIKDPTQIAAAMADTTDPDEPVVGTPYSLEHDEGPSYWLKRGGQRVLGPYRFKTEALLVAHGGVARGIGAEWLQEIER